MKILLLSVVLLLFAACATGPAWDSRVGVSSYDDAVSEMGPPDKVAELSDGTVVAEWLRVRGGVDYVDMGLRPHYAYHPWNYRTIRWPDNYLRLTFTPDRRLQRVQHIGK